jgi:hypothetical protein
LSPFAIRLGQQRKKYGRDDFASIAREALKDAVAKNCDGPW